MGAVALDTSVVIGLLEPGDPHHASTRAEVAAARRRGDTFVLPASVLSEALVGGYRLGTAPDRRRRIVTLFGPVRPIDEGLALVAAELRGRHRSLRLADAFVIATGIVEQAAVLTCDRRLAAVDGRVQVIPPD
ncbi:type II toxin-antitoxin system VapC family toxin [Pseudonocardia acaciae]|uniref:type II toxin-antitoxin system VapC family toxin n=1 Tax=Pseudonocardia acaciae TaxID=551276 RepID=UPI00048CEE1F|nr:PIN domain-containing protein [Pseudonocardia acaciae]